MQIKYQRALVVIAVLVFYTDLVTYLSLPEVASLNPWYWIAALGVATLPLLLTHRSLAILFRSPLMRWCYAYLIITTVWLLCEGVPSEYGWQEFRTRLLSTFFLAVILCLAGSEDAQLWARRAIVLAAILAIGLNVYELINPQTFSFVVGRAAGLYYNPTKSGAALILGMIFGIGVLPQQLRLPFALLVLGGIALTLSRGSMLCWPLVICVLLKTGQLRINRGFVIAGVLFTLLIVIALSQWQAIQYQLQDLGVLNCDVAQRIEGFVNLDEFSSDLSAEKRKEIAGEAFDAFADRPLWGYGVAATKELGFEMGMHNQYLRLMLDHGVFGILLLLLLIPAVLWRARGEALATGLAFSTFILSWSFFSHNILEEYYLLMGFALLAAMTHFSRICDTQQDKVQPGRGGFVSLPERKLHPVA